MKPAHAAALLAALAIDSKHVHARSQAVDALAESQASRAASASSLLGPASVSSASAPATIFQTFVTVTTYEKGRTTTTRSRDLSKAWLARADEDILTISATSEAVITDLTTTETTSGLTKVLPGAPETDLDLALGNVTTSTVLVGSDIYTITRKYITITETKTITQAGNGTCPIITGPEAEPGRGHGPLVGPITSSSATSRPEDATTSFPITTTTPMNITTSLLTTTTTSQLPNITSSSTTSPVSTSTVTSQSTTSSTSSTKEAVPLPDPKEPTKPRPGSDPEKDKNGRKGGRSRNKPVPRPVPLCNPFPISLPWYPKCNKPGKPGLPKLPTPPLPLPCIPGSKKCPFPKIPCASGSSDCDVSRIGPPLLCNPGKVPVPGLGPCETGNFPEIPLPCIPSEEGCVIPPIPPQVAPPVPPPVAPPIPPPVAPPIPPPVAPPIPPSPIPPVPPPPGPPVPPSPVPPVPPSPVPPPTEPPFPSTDPPTPPPGPTPIAPPTSPEPEEPEEPVVQERACNPDTCNPAECEELARCQDTIKGLQEDIREMREITPGNSVGKTNLQRCQEELSATFEEVIKKDDKIEALEMEVAKLKRGAGPRDQAIDDLEGLVRALEAELEIRGSGPGKKNQGKTATCERELKHALYWQREMTKKKVEADTDRGVAEDARDKAIQDKDKAIREKQHMEEQLKKCKQGGRELSNELEQIHEAWETVRRTGKMKCVFRVCLAVKPGQGKPTSPAPPQTGGTSRR